MTALAMIVGMLPMSLGLGEGGEQNAPLGRAVIGGLLVATAFTLIFVPVSYATLRRRPPAQEPADDERDESPAEAALDSAAGPHAANGRSLASRNQILAPGEGR